MPKNLPVISIITPTLNQVSYIEQTIQSVLTQDYPNIEYIIVDGGSTDGTDKVIKKFRKKITYIREKDNGQTNAINKGIKIASGEIVAYINSDDYYEPHVFGKVMQLFISHPKVMWVTGKCKIVNEKNREVRKMVTNYKNLFLRHLRCKTSLEVVQFISQPATFWRRQVHREIGFFDESLHFAMDYDLWLRLYKAYDLYFLDECLANFRVHSHSKTAKDPKSQLMEELEVAKRYTSSPIVSYLHLIHARIALFYYKSGHI